MVKALGGERKCPTPEAERLITELADGAGLDDEKVVQCLLQIMNPSVPPESVDVVANALAMEAEQVWTCTARAFAKAYGIDSERLGVAIADVQRWKTSPEVAQVDGEGRVYGALPGELPAAHDLFNRASVI